VNNGALGGALLVRRGVRRGVPLVRRGVRGGALLVRRGVRRDAASHPQNNNSLELYQQRKAHRAQNSVGQLF
jgi:hypothetical protein